ncbi:MAG: AAA family ATPase [Candidatus Hydrogenedentes bacterium]|nr:AAA family ATPase [Candidatus Hydrogenedentota bacterium]
MYEAFYGLTEKPFNLTPDPRFLYLSDKHKEAFAHLLFGIRNRSGFVVVSGEIGTGKTTICRTLLNQLDENTEVAFIFNPSLSRDELLRKINEDFGIATRAQTPKGLIDELNAYLLERNARGKNCVLVIDEAQDLAPNVLEQIRLLSNLETETQKLLQIVLIGQPELNEILSLDELRQLDQRITARYHLQPLDEPETLQYIAYRIRVAGGRGKIHFSRRAVKAVYRLSGGVPRMINAICDRALLIGYTQESRDISADIVRRAAREVRGAGLTRKKRIRNLRLSRFLPNPTVIAAAVILLIGAKYVVDRVTEAPGPFPARTGRTALGTPADPAPDVGAAMPDAGDAVPVRPAGARHEPGPVVSPAAEAAPPASNDLGDVLDALDPVKAGNAAALAILKRWNVPLQGLYPETDSLSGLAAFARENGLSHEVFFPTLGQLAAADLPALTKLAGNRHAVWVATVALDDENVWITTTIGETVQVPKPEFEKRYLNQALVLWRDPTPEAGPLRIASSGPAVRVLQAQLRGRGYLAEETDGVYGQATAAAVKRLQEDTGLNADGIAGRQTRMVLCSWAPDMPTPSLRNDQAVASVSPPPAPAPAPVVPGPVEAVVADAKPGTGPRVAVEPLVPEDDGEASGDAVPDAAATADTPPAVDSAASEASAEPDEDAAPRRAASLPLVPRNPASEGTGSQ